MNELEGLLANVNDWKYNLYMLIKEKLTGFALLYRIEDKIFDERLISIYLKSSNIISGNKQKYLIINNDKLYASEELRRGLIKYLVAEDESIYDLNKEEILKLLYTYFLIPLNAEMELTEIVKSHRNQKGKEWRIKLYEVANEEYETNQILDKVKALKTAFEKLPDKESHRAEFDSRFKSIYEKFIKLS
jgi:hypothetical protein